MFDKDRVRCIKVMIVDDEQAFREMARHLLEGQEDFCVVGEAASGEEALRLAEELAPDLILMDVYLPETNGFEATKRILEQHPDIKVVLISLYYEKEFSRLASRVGARAAIPKREFTLETLRQILKRN